jgi:glutathione synthase/RimK-type ligase-like ATP-grasp enzyme
MTTNKELAVIGSTTKVSFPGAGVFDVPAKVDTGADSSSVWASNIHEANGKVTFTLFDKTSPYYTGESITTEQFTMRMVKNSFGKSELRYKVVLDVVIENKPVKARFTLANRSKNRYPILVGRRTLQNRFLVDVAHYKPRDDMHILVLVNKRQNSVNTFFRKLQTEFKAPLQVTVATYDDLGFEVNDEAAIRLLDSNVDVGSFDFVFFKTTATHMAEAATIAHYLRRRGIPFADPAAAFYPGVHKMYQYILLSDAGIPVPQTLFMSLKRMKASYKEVKDMLGTPFILKDVQGEKGRNNHLIKTKQEFDKACRAAEREGIEFVAQQFIPNDGDYRVVILARKTALVIHRQAADSTSHLNNVSTGGKATLVKNKAIPGEVHGSSILAADILQFDIAGVDMVQDKETGSWYCLEVNNSPQLASGAFVDEKRAAIAEFLKEAARL